MAYTFGDGWDCYATIADSVAGYWDSGTTTGVTLVAGRFSGSQALNIQVAGGANAFTVKTGTGTTDPVHHIVCAVRQTATITGTTLGLYFQLSDGATNQCCIVFRSDGAILLTSATPGGTVLATYTGAVSAVNTWFAFEFEVIISNTVGAFRARKNGNTSNDFDSGATLNTRPGANTQANKLSLGMNAAITAQQLDDLLWRSDASSVAWVGDVRCYTRMPASDASVQFSRAPTTNTFTVTSGGSTVAVTTGTARYVAFTAPYDGNITAASVSMSANSTSNMKCSIFASAGGVPTTVLGSANVFTNPVIGPNTITFGTPVAVAKGVQYFFGVANDASSGTFTAVSGTTGLSSATAYASFPAASPTTAAAQAINFGLTLTITTNNCLVNEAQQDGAATYVYDSNVNDADFYNVAALAGTPASTIAVTTRGFFEKSDAGTRNGAVQLKSGATTVTSISTALSTSWGWLYRIDTVDPATGAAWTAVGVNAAQIGPTVTA